MQYHPEVMHSPHGQQVLSRFLHEFAGIGAEWTPANIADTLIEQVRGQIGQGHAICGLSGGVDSAVAAALVQRAIGEKLTCVFVDHGLLRAGERAQVQRDFVAATGANLVTVDAAATFLEALTGVTNPRASARSSAASSSGPSRAPCVT
ncbi:tRNA methyl transferase family protein [Mycobacterium xenopi 3993]|nr:tRNA methyl transferase family protein [Mycobacterium xenopi 3993]